MSGEDVRQCLKRVNFVCNFFLEIHYYVFLFCKVDYRFVNVQCPNSTQDNTILMMVLEAVM